MITLYTYGPAFGLRDPSPFVVKTELLLKLSGLPYQTNSQHGASKSPKGKLPYIHDAGVDVADSTFIRWHLEQRRGVDFDQGLSSAEKGVAWCVEKMLEDNLYWTLMESRWRDEANFQRGPATFFGKLPPVVRPLLKTMVRRKMVARVFGQGMGRHAPADIARIGAKDLDAVAAVLGDKPYLMGERACGADASCFAFVQSVLCPHFETPLRAHAQSHANLVAYIKRLQHTFLA